MKTYPITDVTAADLARRFTHHPVVEGQQGRYVALRAEGHALARDIVSMTPPGREQSLALTHLEQAITWANAAIARSGE